MSQNTKPQNKNIDNKSAKKLVEDLMTVIVGEKDVKLLESRVKQLNFGEAILGKRPGKNYPPIRFQLSKAEMDELMGLNVLSQGGTLTRELATGLLENGQPMTALEKLLYSVLWKNGDLGKEHHIVSGFFGNGKPQKTGVVFYEFGGYLSGRNNFILDQHTLRCFAVACEKGDAVTQARQLESIDRTKHAAWIKTYEDFYRAIAQDKGNQIREYAIEVDRLFFGAGKLIKLQKNQGKQTGPNE